MKDKILALLEGTEGFVSGQELCEKFGVSRTAVWKAIHQLQEMGYEIEAVRNKGYCLKNMPDLLSAEAIEAAVRTVWAGKHVIFLPEVDSTNNEAKKMAEDGAPHGTLVIAEQQTAGKGRRGRAFSSPKGCGIWMSLIVKDDIEPAKASMLTLVMGLAVARGIEALTELKPQIKWPNDVILNGRKLCGILTEMSMQVDYVNHIVIGCGVNVQNESFPEDLEKMATSVYIECGKHVSRVKLTAEIMHQFEYYYNKYLPTQDLREIVDEYNECLVNRGKEVRVLDSKETYEGLALGINTAGELMVQTKQDVRYVTAGEVSVRGVYGYV